MSVHTGRGTTPLKQWEDGAPCGQVQSPSKQGKLTEVDTHKTYHGGRYQHSKVTWWLDRLTETSQEPGNESQRTWLHPENSPVRTPLQGHTPVELSLQEAPLTVPMSLPVAPCRSLWVGAWSHLGSCPSCGGGLRTVPWLPSWHNGKQDQDDQDDQDPHSGSSSKKGKEIWKLGNLPPHLLPQKPWKQTEWQCPACTISSPLFTKQ